MKYQLVFQFVGDTLQHYDDLIAFEDRLIEVLGSSHVIDGHDFGPGETNIFVHTNDPGAAFAAAKRVIPAEALGISLRVAYRELGGSDYSSIWPVGSTARFEVK
jgi:hypothetical protein